MENESKPMEQETPKKTKPQKIEDKIKSLKEQIIANSKDAQWCKKMIVQLSSLQKQADIEAVELVVPCAEVTEVLDFDSYVLKRTPRGILFQAKGGLSTFVEMRMLSVYEMLDRVFYLHNNPAEDEETQQLYSSYCDAVAYVLQSPIFSSLSEKLLFETAANLLRGFNEYVEGNYTNAELKTETEEDIQANIRTENVVKAVEEIAKAEIPTPITDESE